MKSQLFYTAVLDTINESKKTPFSAYEITKSLRQKVNREEVEFSDKQPNDRGGYSVNHEDVKEIVNEVFEIKLFPDFTRKIDNKDANSFFRYTFENSQTQEDEEKYEEETACGGNCVCKAQKATKAANKYPFESRVDLYIKNKIQNHEVITLKGIQGSLKTKGITISEIANVVVNLGYAINTNYTNKYSLSTVI